MGELPDIIKSQIILAKWDTFWQDISNIIGDKAHAPLLVLTSSYNNESSETAQLQKMLQACTLTPDQYNIIQLSENKYIAWHQLKQNLAPKAILLLGILPEYLGISAMFHLFTPNHFDACIWICGPSLTDLEQQPESKKQLWINGLKPVFVDKTIGNF